MSIAGEHVSIRLAADIKSERMLLPSGSLRKRILSSVVCNWGTAFYRRAIVYFGGKGSDLYSNAGSSGGNS